MDITFYTFSDEVEESSQEGHASSRSVPEWFRIQGNIDHQRFATSRISDMGMEVHAVCCCPAPPTDRLFQSGEWLSPILRSRLLRRARRLVWAPYFPVTSTRLLTGCHYSNLTVFFSRCLLNFRSKSMLEHSTDFTYMIMMKLSVAAIEIHRSGYERSPAMGHRRFMPTLRMPGRFKLVRP